MANPIRYYVVRGPVRGFISKHRVEDRAHLAVIRDRKACRSPGGGAYSDARVYAKHANGDLTGPYPFPEHLWHRA